MKKKIYGLIQFWLERTDKLHLEKKKKNEIRDKKEKQKEHIINKTTKH